MNDPYQPPQAPPPPDIPSEVIHSRHGCLTTFLILMLLANFGTVLLYAVTGERIRALTPGMPVWAMPVLIAVGLFNLVCAIALFRWKKWGFWGFAASACVAVGVNIAIGINPVKAIFGIIGVAVLYGVLQIGNGNKGWPQLK